jgi:ornithine carbamoyltransferase
MSTLMNAVEKIEKLGVSDLVSDRELSRNDLNAIFQTAQEIKRKPRAYAKSLEGKQLAMIFEKPSLRTRVTFEVGITSMGGHAVYLEHVKPRLGERESIKDVARNLERWVDGIVARTFQQSAVAELAENACVPVINALTDAWHPCQVIADYFTMGERFGKLKGLKLAFIGDGNNMCHSYINAARQFDFRLHIAAPQGYQPNAGIVAAAGERVRLFGEALEAASGADLVVTDVWASMGQEEEQAEREKVFAAFQVNAQLMQQANSDALFMHCLPAHRGEEVTADVIDGERSVVWDEAENRLHAQKALLEFLLTSANPPTA